MVTVTGVEVSPDLSHAKVFFTHLAGARARRRRRSRRCSTPPATCAPSSSHRLDALLGAAAALRLRRLDRVRPALSKLIDDAVADDRKHPPIDRSARLAARAASAASTACCCSTRPSGLSSNAALQHAQATASAPRRRATPERSIRWPPVCCRSASARRPSSRSSCSTPTSRTLATLRLGVTTTTGDAEGEVDRAPRCACPTRDEFEAVLAALRRDDLAAVRRAMPRSSTRAAATTNTRARASTFRAPRARSTIRSLRARTRGRRRDVELAVAAAREPTFACWRRTSARRWAAARIWRRCAGRPPVDSTLPMRVTLDALEAMTCRAARCPLLPVDSLLRGAAALRAFDDARPRRCSQGRPVGASGDAAEGDRARVFGADASSASPK